MDEAPAEFRSIPPLPPPAGRVESVTTVAELLRAARDVQSDTTILLQAGRYVLAEPLRLGKRDQSQPLKRVALRGATGKREDVIIENNGVEIRDVEGLQVAAVTFANSRGPSIQIAGAASSRPHIFNVRVVDAAGTMLRVARTTRDGSVEAVHDGIVEYSVFEYTDVAPSRSSEGGLAIVGGRDWIIRYNLFRNIRAGRDAPTRLRPAVTVRGGSSGATTHNNLFIDCERAIAYGMAAADEPADNTAGVIYNNFIYRRRGLAGDAGIMLWGSPGTKVYHNTVVQNGTYQRPIEHRFATTTNVDIRNNLTDGAIEARDGAQGVAVGNYMQATPSLFRNAAAGDLRLLETAAQAIDRGVVLPAVTFDWDGERRPFGRRLDIGADEWLPNRGTAPRNAR